MSALVLVLIVIAAVVALGPVMLLFSRLNKVNPFILDEDNPVDDVRSMMIVSALKPLFFPLWVEKRVIDWISGHGRK